jgi:hypothetical protein
MVTILNIILINIGSVDTVRETSMSHTRQVLGLAKSPSPLELSARAVHSKLSGAGTSTETMTRLPDGKENDMQQLVIARCLSLGLMKAYEWTNGMEGLSPLLFTT